MSGWTTEGLVARGKVVRELKPCGTVAAYHRHKRNKEQPCEACLDAWAEYTRSQRRAARPASRGPRRHPTLTVVPAVPLAPLGTLPCTADPDAWFPEADDHRAVDAAKKACRTCPALTPCLEWVTANPQEHGVWAGMSERERRRLKSRAA